MSMRRKIVQVAFVILFSTLVQVHGTSATDDIDPGFYTSTTASGTQRSIWYSLSPAPTTRNLLGVSRADAVTATVVGEVGTIIRTTNDGATWETQNSGTTNNLTAVCFVNALTGTVVGEDGLILRTTDGGISWNPQNSGTTADFRDVHFIDEWNGLAGTSSTTVRTTDGGNTWTTAEYHPGVLYSVHLADSLIGYTAGTFYDTQAWNGVICKTYDGGHRWSMIKSYYDMEILDTQFKDTETGLVVATWPRWILRTNDGGDTWTPPTAPVSFYKMRRVCYVDALTAVAVGDQGDIIRTTDGGDSWYHRTSQVSRALRDVSLAAPGTGTAVGNAGTIICTKDGGDTWESRPSARITEDLRGVFVTDALTATVVGDVGRIYRTTDGGYNWLPQTSGVTADLHAVFFLDSMRGTAVGTSSKIIQTTDGGETWIGRPNPAVYQLNDVYFVDDTTAVAVGNYSVFVRSVDGGLNWDRKSVSPPLHHVQGVYFVNGMTGTTVGANGQIRKTINGGVDWTAPASGTAEQLNDVWFFDALTGIAVGDNGTILRTTDGGDTWESQASGTTRHLNAVWIDQTLNGWAAGESGTILQTADGGLTWGSQTVTTQNHLGISFTGSHTGMIVGEGGVILKTDSTLLVPTVVRRFHAIPSTDRVTLSWNIESDDVVFGFRLLRERADNKTASLLPEHGLLNPDVHAYTDRNVEPAREYVYTLLVRLSNGDEIRSQNVRVTIASIDFYLKQNVPNPFNPTTTISYAIGERTHAKIDLFDVSGRWIRTLVDAVQDAGAKSTVWDGRNRSGESVASGVYFYRLRAGDFSETRKMVLIR